MKRKGLTVISMLLAAILILGCASSGGRIHSEAGGGTLKDMAGRVKNSGKKAALTKAYGVFPGLERKDRNRLKGYETVVIDAEYFTSADIARMHKAGQKVYSYLNVGSLETYRSYYKKFKSITIGKYENWPDEYWIDVSKASWQKYVVNTLAKKLVQKRVDGFFLDNTDIYYIRHNKKIYNGLIKILKDLKKYKKNVIINGGDTFVAEALKRKDFKKGMVKGVNQECVITRINFKKKSFSAQSRDSRKYFERYLAECKKRGLSIYLTEYAQKGSRLEKDVAKYCKSKKYQYYVSHNIQLNGL